MRSVAVESLLTHEPAGSCLVGCLEAEGMALLGTCSAGCRSAADAHVIWRLHCERLWARKQQSLYIRRWLAEPGTPGRGETLRSWKERYTFALRDSRRRRMLPEELVYDSAADPATGDHLLRRWNLRIKIDFRWEDKEVVFHPRWDPYMAKAFHIGFFKESLFEAVPWEPMYGEDAADAEADASAAGFPMVMVPSLNSPLEVGRTEDWGWTLRLMRPDPVHAVFTSRQLSLKHHRLARVLSPWVNTIYCRALSTSSGSSSLPRCGRLGPQGSWEVFQGYQGLMPAPTWIGAVWTLAFTDDDQGVCSWSLPTVEASGIHISYSFVTGAGASQLRQGHLTVYNGSRPTSCTRWIRGQTTAGDSAGSVPPLVLVIDRTHLKGGGRPQAASSIPDGLPSVDSFPPSAPEPARLAWMESCFPLCAPT